MNLINSDFKDGKLIIVIVKKGKASMILNYARKVGAKGGTIIYGKGTAKRSIYESILGVEYKPEKEILLIVAKETYVNKILNTILSTGELYKKGVGIGVVLDLKKYAGVAHLLRELAEKEER